MVINGSEPSLPTIARSLHGIAPTEAIRLPAIAVKDRRKVAASDGTERSHRPADRDGGKGPHVARDPQDRLQVGFEEDGEDRQVRAEPKAARREKEVLDAGVDARRSRPVKDASTVAGHRHGSGWAELPGGAEEPREATPRNVTDDAHVVAGHHEGRRIREVVALPADGLESSVVSGVVDRVRRFDRDRFEIELGRSPPDLGYSRHLSTIGHEDVVSRLLVL